jgi:hypothetical protein
MLLEASGHCERLYETEVGFPLAESLRRRSVPSMQGSKG